MVVADASGEIDGRRASGQKSTFSGAWGEKMGNFFNMVYVDIFSETRRSRDGEDRPEAQDHPNEVAIEGVLGHSEAVSNGCMRNKFLPL
eukprot:11278013-Karenia_brevis.AAC.1